MCGGRCAQRVGSRDELIELGRYVSVNSWHHAQCVNSNNITLNVSIALCTHLRYPCVLCISVNHASQRGRSELSRWVGSNVIPAGCELKTDHPNTDCQPTRSPPPRPPLHAAPPRPRVESRAEQRTQTSTQAPHPSPTSSAWLLLGDPRC